MKKSFWIFLFLSTLLVIFSVQNAEPVEVDFFFNKVSVSLAVLLIVVFLTGVIAGASYFFIKLKMKTKKKVDDHMLTDETNDIDAED